MKTTPENIKTTKLGRLIDLTKTPGITYIIIVEPNDNNIVIATMSRLSDAFIKCFTSGKIKHNDLVEIETLCPSIDTNAHVNIFKIRKDGTFVIRKYIPPTHTQIDLNIVKPILQAYVDLYENVAMSDTDIKCQTYHDAQKILNNIK